MSPSRHSMLHGHWQRCEMLRAWAAHDADTFRAFTTTVTRITERPVSQLRILDLGCGTNAPMTVCLSAAGAEVTGVDAKPGHRWGLGIRPARYVQYAKEVGWARTARKAAGELVYDRLYFSELARRTNLRLRDDGLDLRPMDIHTLDLPADAFDVVHSNATWEHLADVSAANRAVARVLRPSGVAYIEIHLFPSLSGGHDLPWIVPGKTMLGDGLPWRHLRDAAWKPPVFLNRWRERDYRSAFDADPELEIVEWQTEFTEGQEYLTDEVRRALPDYADAELTTRSIIVVARKRGAAATAPGHRKRAAESTRTPALVDAAEPRSRMAI